MGLISLLTLSIPAWSADSSQLERENGLPGIPFGSQPSEKIFAGLKPDPYWKTATGLVVLMDSKPTEINGVVIAATRYFFINDSLFQVTYALQDVKAIGKLSLHYHDEYGGTLLSGEHPTWKLDGPSVMGRVNYFPVDRCATASFASRPLREDALAWARVNHHQLPQ